MAQQYFSLKDRDQVARFDALAAAYEKARLGYSIKPLSLVKAYDYCQTRDDGGKLFAALLDIFINFSLMSLDSHSVGGIWNSHFSSKDKDGGSVLDSEPDFFGKMDIHRFNSSFVFRYRALWDKLMGLMILMYAPGRYEKFESSKSRRRAFKTCSSGVNQISAEFTEKLEKILNDFDNEFRTPETHGTGALRKWSFSMESMTENPTVKLIGHWNIMVEMLGSLDKAFTPNETMQSQ